MLLKKVGIIIILNLYNVYKAPTHTMGPSRTQTRGLQAADKDFIIRQKG